MLDFLMAQRLVDDHFAPRHIVIGSYCVGGEGRFRYWDATEFAPEGGPVTLLGSAGSLSELLGMLGVPICEPEAAHTVWGQFELGGEA